MRVPSRRAPWSLILLAFLVGETRAAEPAPLRIAFPGQALIQHDLRKLAPEKSTALAAALRTAQPEVLFTDLETVIDMGAGKPTRDTQFFHAAGPEVLDCLRDWGFNVSRSFTSKAWWGHSTVRVGVNNVFDKEPPFALGASSDSDGYLRGFGDPRGRAFSFEITKHF